MSLENWSEDLRNTLRFFAIARKSSSFLCEFVAICSIMQL